MAPFFPSSFSRRRRESHCEASPAPQNLKLHLVQISSQPCFLPFPPPSRFSSSLPFTTDIFLDPGSWSVTVTVPCPFPCSVLSCSVLPCPALPGLLAALQAALQMQSCSSYSLVRSGFFSLSFSFTPVYPPSSACHGSGMSSQCLPTRSRAMHITRFPILGFQAL